jgi:hypothetical protein
VLLLVDGWADERRVPCRDERREIEGRAVSNVVAIFREPTLGGALAEMM